jgi:predicted type IV restriction endonuclease
MTESLRETLEDIRRKLAAGVYQNEEHVRLSLVARVLQALGWETGARDK